MMGVFCGALLGAAAWGRSWILEESAPIQLGSRPAILSRLEGIRGERPLSFAVVGDSHGSAVFNEILKKLKEEKLDFIVHLGDFAPAPDERGHRLFMAQVKENLGPQAPPILLVMGNHDVDRGFPVQAFEELYGPSTYSFQVGGNLFLVVRNCLPRSLRDRAEAATKGWGHEVRRTLQERGGSAKRIFLFMHAPPLDPLAGIQGSRARRFRSAWGDLGVDYLVAGHLHQYSRMKMGSSVLLISGGGGGTLRSVRSGRFHHAVIMRLDGDRITEELVTVRDPWEAIPWRLRRRTVVGIYRLLSLWRGGPLGEEGLSWEPPAGSEVESSKLMAGGQAYRPRDP